MKKVSVRALSLAFLGLFVALVGFGVVRYALSCDNVGTDRRQHTAEKLFPD